VRAVRGDLRARRCAGHLIQSVRLRHRRVHVRRPLDHVGVAWCPDPGGGSVHTRRTGHCVLQRVGRDVREMFAGLTVRPQVSAHRVWAVAAVPGRPQRHRCPVLGRPVARSPGHLGDGRAGRLHGNGRPVDRCPVGQAPRTDHQPPEHAQCVLHGKVCE